VKNGVSVVVPAKNEANNLPAVVKGIRSVSKDYEILIVDDGSTDETSGVAKKLGCTCIRLNRNRGKGYACRVGAKHAANEFIVFIDSDSQLNPGEIPKFVRALEQNDVVIGTRRMTVLPWQRRMANSFSKKMIRVATGQRFSDVLCGFRAVRKSKFLTLGLEKNRYEFESELLIKSALKRFKIAQIPVYVSYDVGSRMRFKESLKVSGYLFKQAVKNAFS